MRMTLRPSAIAVLSIAMGLATPGTPSLAAAQTLTGAGARTTQDTAAQQTTRVALFADGNVRGAVIGKEGATATSGSIGLGVSTRLSNFAAVINIAAKPDTVTRNFGATVVSPATGGALNAGLIDYRWHKQPKGRGWGWHGYGSISSARWATDTNAAGKATATTDVAFLGAGAAASYEVVRGTVGENFAFAALDLGLAYRGLFGDIATKANTDLKRRLYGTAGENWLGVEFGVALQINLVKAGINYYFFPRPNARGVTDGQVVAGFSLQANVFQGDLK
jgi:hypothetical protein